MRSGLVFVGGLVAVLGIAALVAFNLFPTTTERREAFSSVPTPFAPNATAAVLIPGSDTAPARLSLTWKASAPIDVDLFPAVGCTVPAASCASGPVLEHWSAQVSGDWSTSGGLRFPYLIVWSSPPSSAGTFSVSGTESSDIAVPPSVVDALLVDGAAAALSVIGAVAVFLGLFLRSGVYRGPAPIVSRSADDVDAVVGQGPPPGR